MDSGVKRPGLVAIILSGALLLAAPALSAAPAGAGNSSEEAETAALNLQSLQNSQIVNPPGPGGEEAVQQNVSPYVPPAVGSARGGGGKQRANNLGGGGGRIGKAPSRGSRGGNGVVKNKGQRRNRRQG